VDSDYHYADHFFDEDFPGWRDSTPEEYVARHWLRFGACTLTRSNKFRDKQMLEWITRFEEISHNMKLLKECRVAHLTIEERKEQDRQLQSDGLP